MGLMGDRGALDDPRIKRNLPHQRQFRRIGKQIEIRGLEQINDICRQIGKCLTGVAEDRLATGVTVLHVENRIVARLLDHLGEVEVERGVVLAKQHHEADGIAPDFIDDLAKRNELACPLGHLDRLAARKSLTSWTSFTSSSAWRSLSAATAACMRLI